MGVNLFDTAETHMDPRNWVPLGRGKVDYASVFRKGKTIGVKWYILEMDKYDGDVYAGVDPSLTYVIVTIY